MARILAIHHLDSRDTGIYGPQARAAGHVFDEWCPADGGTPPDDPSGYDALVVYGGGVNVAHADEHPYLQQEIALVREHLEAGNPILGICLGGQLLATAAGAVVRRATRPEIGWFEVRRLPDGQQDPVFAALPERFTAYQWHSWTFDLPEGAVELATSDVCRQAYRLGDKAWGLQFHPEVTERILHEWFDDYRADPDAVRLGLDPRAAKAQLPQYLPGWNEVGRVLFDAWLEAGGLRPATARQAA
jgi:GMP synthase-like glutamine amidotransferase